MSNVLPPIKKEIYVKRDAASKPYQTWWLADERDVANYVLQLVETIQSNSASRHGLDLKHAYLYQNRQMSELIAVGASGTRGLPERYNVTYNVVKSATDTLTAKIAQNKPRPRTLTVQGSYDEQTRAKLLTMYTDGVFTSDKTYRKGTQVFKDGCIFGTGVLKVITDYDRKRVCTERVLPTEILVDDLEAQYGEPKSMYQRRNVAREVLLRQFPEAAQAIVGLAPLPMKNAKTAAVDMVRVVEAWHLPDSEGKHGRHVICIEDKCLYSEEWNHDVFPFAFFRYQTSIASFYGQGVAEELMGTQIEINKLLRDIQIAQHRVAVPRVMIENNSKVVPSHLGPEIGSGVRYTGQMPVFVTPTAMNNEVYTHVKWLITSSYEKVGLSQLSASGKKPAGLDSQVALREQQDIESERFATTETNYRDFFNDVANLIVEFSAELYTEHKDLEVTAITPKFIKKIKWSDVNMDRDRFVMHVESSSIFPTQAPAKLQKVEELVRSGWMTKEDGIREMAHPDVEAWETLEMADRDYLERIIGDILSKGEYRAPEPEMMIPEDINIARKHYLEALNNEVDPDRIDMLYRWIEAAGSLLPEIPAAAPVMPGVAPLATPLPLPQSGMLPQV